MNAYTKNHNRFRALFLFSVLVALFFLAQGARGQGYNSSRSNRTAPVALDVDSDNDGLTVEGTLHVGTDDTARLSLYGDGNDKVTRKRPGRVKYGDVTLKRGTLDRCFSDGGLEHTDDWIAARAAAPGDPVPGIDITLVSVSGRDEADAVLACSRDVHSGKLTGVRQHSPVRTKEIDAATPHIYRALVGKDGSFVFENVEPGDYLVVADVNASQGYVGHVTVLK